MFGAFRFWGLWFETVRRIAYRIHFCDGREHRSKTVRLGAVWWPEWYVVALLATWLLPSAGDTDVA
jgi:hypothetical protein